MKLQWELIIQGNDQLNKRKLCHTQHRSKISFLKSMLLSYMGFHYNLFFFVYCVSYLFLYVLFFPYLSINYYYYLNRGKQWNVCANLEKDKHARDVKFLDNYAMERWEVRYFYCYYYYIWKAVNFFSYDLYICRLL